MIGILNMDMPRTCYDRCPFKAGYYCSRTGKVVTSTKRNRFCPLIEIDDEIWKALKPKVETMSMALTGWVEDSNADQRTQCVESVEGDEQEEWLDYREEQEFNDRWEKE